MLVRFVRLVAVSGFLAGSISPAIAQFGPSGPPAVGVVEAKPQSITASTEFSGRLQSPQRVDLVARVTGFLEGIDFVEGAVIKKGDLLYQIERGPFEADVAAKAASVEQAKAVLDNANLTLQRAQDLYQKSAGPKSTVDNAQADQRSAQAQVTFNEAQLRVAQINLDYTRIIAPIDGLIGRTAVTVGNVVGPNSGVLTTVVSHDQMYVLFPVSVRRLLELRTQMAATSGQDDFTMHLRLSDGSMYSEAGKVTFMDNTVAQDTDTIMLRGTIVNKPIPPERGGDGVARELTNGAFVTVVLEGGKPVDSLAVPRAAILSDQQGDYVYVVDDKNIAQQRRIKLGQSTPVTAAVVEGLNAGDKVIVTGIQSVRPNSPVSPAPAATPAATAIQQR